MLTVLKPEFVEFMPEALADGVLYISMKYGVAIHLCCCGCGKQTVTPVDLAPASPGVWQLVIDGGLISLEPSIGSQQLPCRSHYKIKDNQVQWL